MQLDEVRTIVGETLQGLGLEGAQLLGERIVLQDRFYIGRRFEYESVSALWLVEAHQIKFYNAEGEFITSVQLDQQQPTLRRAA
jgi:hypothetical protein